jgi:hypothetical protein
MSIKDEDKAELSHGSPLIMMESSHHWSIKYPKLPCPAQELI